MNLTVVLRPDARREYLDAIDWYVARSPVLGAEFETEIDRVLTLISNRPEIGTVIRDDVRRVVADRFPYVILYIPTDSMIDVVSVFHTRRDPAIWQARVDP